jgi:hypothetical protein
VRRRKQSVNGARKKYQTKIARKRIRKYPCGKRQMIYALTVGNHLQNFLDRKEAQ